jgi:hypothetical protein
MFSEGLISGRYLPPLHSMTSRIDRLYLLSRLPKEWTETHENIAAKVTLDLWLASIIERGSPFEPQLS